MEKQKKVIACLLTCAMLLTVFVPNMVVFAAESDLETASESISEAEAEQTVEQESTSEAEASEPETQVESQTTETGMSVEEMSKAVGHGTSVVANPTGKKGIIASYWTDPGTVYYDDPIALGVDHALFNIDITELVSTNGSGEPFVYNGKTYYYNNYEGQQLYYTFLRMQEIRDKGITITAQVNMQWSNDAALQQLIFPSGREPGHNYYALNTSTAQSREILAAAFHYLVTKCPYVNNWIVGCEINSPAQANYCGTLDVNTNVIIAAQTYDLMYQAIQDVNPAAKNYVCLDNIWNFDNGEGIPAKKFLEEFAKYETNKTWHLAFHPYPVPYGSTENPAEWLMWSKKSAENNYLAHDVYSGFITGANIEVLSNFVKENYGSQHRIILTEFGFDARAGEANQAAALYYTYKAAERDDMIDACIYQPWTDTGWDFREMGVLDSAGNKRQMYNVFKYMDSDGTLANEAYYKSVLGISNWTDNIIYQVSTNTDDSKIMNGVYIPDDDGITIKAGAIIDTNETGLTYECTVIDYDYASYGTPMFPEVKRTQNKQDNWMSYVPTHAGMYGFCWRAYRNGQIISESGATHYFVGNNTITDAKLWVPDRNADTLRFGMVFNARDKQNVRITWFLYRPDDGVYEAILSDGTVKEKGEWQSWTKKPGRYWIMCRVTALTNPSSSLCWGVEVRNGVVIDP